MYKITNKTPHPHDLHTKSGVKVIGAYGSIEADFDPAYLDIIRLGFDVEKVGEKVELKDEPARTEAPSPVDPREEYETLTGKKPDGRWSEERILSELEGLRS